MFLDGMNGRMGMRDEGMARADCAIFISDHSMKVFTGLARWIISF